jgi:hypothetical protein
MVRHFGGIRRPHRLARGRIALAALPQQKLADEADNFELNLVAVRRERVLDHRFGNRRAARLVDSFLLNQPNS